MGLGEDRDIYFKVHGSAEDDLRIVGTGGTALHWDGTALAAVATDAQTGTSTAPLLTIDAGGDRPIAVGGAGNGLILEYNGDEWHDLSPDFQPGFNGVCTGADAAWAVGQYGARAAREDDGWVSDSDRSVTPSSVQDWHACAIDHNGGLWTVGGRIASRPLIDGVVGYQGVDEPPDIALE